MHRGKWALIALFVARAASAADATLPIDQGSSELRPRIERYSADLATLNRTYPLPGSEERQRQFEQFFTHERQALDSVDFTTLSQDGRIDYVLFRNLLDHQKKQMEIDRAQDVEMQPLIPFAKTIIQLEESRRRMETMDVSKTADMLAKMADEIAAVRKSSEKMTVKPAVANRAAARLNQLRSNLQHWYKFYDGYNPAFTWRVEEPYKRADQAVDIYSRFLREHFGGVRSGEEAPIIGDPVGADALTEALRYAMIPYTPDELIAIANKEFAWCDNQMLRASRELGYGDDWHKALEFVKTKYVEPGKQVDLVRDLAHEAIDFVKKRDLVTIPPLAEQDWWEEMLSPERQLVAPFFLGGEVILVASPTNTMTEDQKQMSLRANNIYFSRATVFHELIPGHHLQDFMTDRFRTYREPFSTPFWTEGNAFYWEMLLWDLGFAKTPEQRIGMLFWRMHRCARIIFSLSFHTEKMTAQQCVDFLVNRVGHERSTAEAEVRRSIDGSYPPIYQCAYMLGALQFYALHKELVDSGKMTNRVFHDTILKENRIPVEMIRADMTKQKLTRDYQTSWRFYGDVR